MKKILMAIGVILVVTSCKKGSETATPTPPYVPPVAVSGQWRKMIDGINSDGISNPATFVIGSNAYMLQGNKFYVYDQSTNSWGQKANFPGPRRTYGVGIAIGQKGYFGSGNFDTLQAPVTLYDFWEYDPSADSWKQKKDMSLQEPRAMFSIGSKGYFWSGGGIFHEYDPATDTWTRKSNFTGGSRDPWIHFGIGTKGYIGTEADGSFFGGFREYDPVSNTWTKKADQPFEPFVSFAGTSKGYIYGHFNSDANGVVTYFNYFAEYIPSTDKWIMKTDFKGESRQACLGFVINDKPYIGLGWHYGKTSQDPSVFYNDLWEYTP